jgi:hypothetical protein
MRTGSASGVFDVREHYKPIVSAYEKSIWMNIKEINFGPCLMRLRMGSDRTKAMSYRVLWL